jgi:hypothetical protein
MASDSATNATTPRSRRWRTAGTMSPWRRNDSPARRSGRYRFPPMTVAEVTVAGPAHLGRGDRSAQQLIVVWKAALCYPRPEAQEVVQAAGTDS